MYHHFYRQGFFLKHGRMPTTDETLDFFDGDPKAQALIEYADAWYVKHPDYKNVAWDVLVFKIANDMNLKHLV